MEAVRADGKGAAAGGADQEEPGGEAEEEVTNRASAYLKKTTGVTIPTLDPEPERFGNSGCQFNGTKKGPIRPKKGPAIEKLLFK